MECRICLELTIRKAGVPDRNLEGGDAVFLGRGRIDRRAGLEIVRQVDRTNGLLLRHPVALRKHLGVQVVALAIQLLEMRKHLFGELFSAWTGDNSERGRLPWRHHLPQPHLPGLNSRAAQNRLSPGTRSFAKLRPHSPKRRKVSSPRSQVQDSLFGCGIERLDSGRQIQYQQRCC